ncbi:MAG: hypothetical protein SFZ24_04040 [Planctomycetota bacterium]|nr:hypothetical protein [Planctomycetota bacterium]
MRSVFIVLACFLSVCTLLNGGCSKNPQDKLKSQLVGRWRTELSNVFVSGSAVWTFQADGTWRCDAEASNSILGKTNVVVSGTYDVVSDRQVKMVGVVDGKQQEKMMDFFFHSEDEMTMNEVGESKSHTLKRVK